MTTEFTAKPDEIMYMPLPDGQADVWLRKEIAEAETEDGVTYTAQEVYFRTSLTKEEVEADFDTLFENGGEPVEEIVEITMEERMEAVEDGFAELAEIVAEKIG